MRNLSTIYKYFIQFESVLWNMRHLKVRWANRRQALFNSPKQTFDDDNSVPCVCGTAWCECSGLCGTGGALLVMRTQLCSLLFGTGGALLEMSTQLCSSGLCGTGGALMVMRRQLCGGLCGTGGALLVMRTQLCSSGLCGTGGALMVMRTQMCSGLCGTGGALLVMRTQLCSGLCGTVGTYSCSVVYMASEAHTAVHYSPRFLISPHRFLISYHR